MLSAKQGRSTGLNDTPTVHQDEPMEEVSHPDNIGIRTGNSLDNTSHCYEGADGKAVFTEEQCSSYFLLLASITDFCITFFCYQQRICSREFGST